MKFLLTIIIFIITPIIFCAMLMYAAIPLLIQHFFRSKEIQKAKVYPYLTSWEEAA